VVNGERVRVNKRPRPTNCELCGRLKKILGYHHWDDDDPSKGVWVCGNCHWIVGAYEKKHSDIITERYIKLKSEIEQLKILA